MYYSWIEDHNEKLDMIKNHGVLVGSFFNPEAAKRMINDQNGSRFESSDKDFEESWNKVVEHSDKIKEAMNSKRRRVRRKVLKEL